MAEGKSIEMTADFVRETEKAILISDGDNKIWLPKSQIDYELDEFKGVVYLIDVPEWLAVDKGLV